MYFIANIFYVVLHKWRGGRYQGSQESNPHPRREKHAIPGDLKAASFNKFKQGCLAINIEMPMELSEDGLQLAALP